jgi:hypothetical protein
MKTWSPVAPLALAAALAGGCAALEMPEPPDVPADLRPPATQSPFLEATASGQQVYECAARPGMPAAFQWTPRGAEAALVDLSGRPVGRHYYPGPTWEAVDGSKVITEVKVRRPSPDPSSVPWLLLASKSHTGEGMFAQTRSIQRVRTSGGIAPSETCGASNAGNVARVPYTATFYFYREGT